MQQINNNNHHNNGWVLSSSSSSNKNGFNNNVTNFESQLNSIKTLLFGIPNKKKHLMF